MTLDEELAMYTEIAEDLDRLVMEYTRAFVREDVVNMPLRLHDIKVYARNLNRRLQQNRRLSVHLCK